eukprot:gene7416-9117_t
MINTSRNLIKLICRSSTNVVGRNKLLLSSSIRQFSSNNTDVDNNNSTNNATTSNQTSSYYNNKKPRSPSETKVLFNDEKFYSEEKYEGISKEPFPESIVKILMEDLNDQDIEIKPDGIIYLPEIKYRRILNEAFKPGGWALKPMGPPIVDNNTLIRPYALYCFGRYISEAIGEQPYYEGFNSNMSFATATEAAKSNALVRCCKDLGIGSSLWDPIFIRRWKSEYSVEKFFENQKSKEKKKFWVLKNGGSNQIPYPWKEIDFNPNFETKAPQQETINFSGSESSPSNQQPQRQQYQQSQQAARPAATQQAAAADQDVEIDIDDVVPPQMKKYQGKTWRELLGDPQGYQYIQWVANKFGAESAVGFQANAILQFVEDEKNKQRQNQDN